MSYQFNFGFSSPEKVSSEIIQEKKEDKESSHKPFHKPSHAKLTVTINPLLSLKLPTSQSKTLQKSDEAKSPRVRKDQSSGKQIKTVNQVFRNVHPSSKRSVGGTSLQPILPHSHSSPYLSRKKSKVSSLTPRVKVSKTPRSESLASHTLSPILPSNLGDVEEAAQHLNAFINIFQQQMLLLNQVLQPIDKVDEREEFEATHIDLAYQMLSNGLSDEWIALRHELDKLLLQQDYENDSVDISEEYSNSHCINLHNLGLDYQLDESTSLTHTNKTSLNKTSLKKSLKEEKHLQIAFEFMVNLVLDFQDQDPWKQKENIKKMLQFIPHKFEIDKTLPSIAFNYINQLFLLSEILKQGSHNIDKLLKDSHLLANLVIDHAQKFLKAIRDVREIKKLDKEERKEKLDGCCCQYGNTIKNYTQTLLKRLHGHISEIDVQFSNKNLYNSALIKQMEKDICNRSLTYCDGFETDFGRSIKGRFLHLASNKKDIDIPKITKEVRKEDKEYTTYCYRFLAFLMQNMGIDCDSIIDSFNPLKKLKETQSLATVYEDLEKEWTYFKETSSESKIEGVFKLLPILRVFNQNNLLSLHKSMLMMQKVIEALENPEVNHLPLSLPFPTAVSSKYQQKEQGELLERESKSIQIKFKDDKIYLILKHISSLSHSSITSENTHNYFFNDCAIKASFSLCSSIYDMNNWTIQTLVEIDRPKESANINFLRRYSLMIAVLQSIGINYHENLK